MTELPVLEEKLRRAMEFQKYLEDREISETPGGKQLIRDLGCYRASLSNLIDELTKPKRKPKRSG